VSALFVLAHGSWACACVPLSGVPLLGVPLSGQKFEETPCQSQGPSSESLEFVSLEDGRVLTSEPVRRGLSSQFLGAKQLDICKAGACIGMCGRYVDVGAIVDRGMVEYMLPDKPAATGGKSSA